MLNRFYSIDWEILPEKFRRDLNIWWSEKADTSRYAGSVKGVGPEADQHRKDQRELAAIDCAKALGYVLSPDLFMEKHGEGQVKHLDIKDVYYAKIICEKHGVPFKLKT